MSALGVDHAPILTRHGWLTRRYWPAPTTTGPAPETCPAVASHKTWPYGFLSATGVLHLDAHVCDHDTRTARRTADAQGVLW